MASYSQRSGTWSAGLPDLNEPAPRVVNPPLYGTSLTAVPWQPGIGVVSGSMLPQSTSNWMTLHRCIRKESVSYHLSAFAQSLNIHTKKIDLYALTFAKVYSRYHRILDTGPAYRIASLSS